MTLYEINHDLAERLAQLGERLENGETPSQDEIDELLDLKSNLIDKLINYGKFIKNQQSDIDGLDNEIKRLTAKKKALQNRTDILKDNMLIAMQECGVAKIDDPIMPIRIQNSVKSVRLDIDPTRLPAEFQKLAVTADKTALKKALESGQEIAGAVLEQGQHIRIG